MDIVTNRNDNRAVCHLLICLIKICNEHGSFRNEHGTQNIIASGLLQLFEIHQNLHFSTSASISCAKFRSSKWRKTLHDETKLAYKSRFTGTVDRVPDIS